MQEGFDVEGYLKIALSGGVGGVVLHVPGNAVDVAEQEGEQGHVISPGQRRVHGIEAADVVWAVVGGKGDAGQRDAGATVLELGDDAGEVRLSLLDGEAAQAVVAAELDDDDLGVLGQNELDAVQAVLGGVAADAGVEDVVGVALGVQKALQVSRVGR